MGALHICVGLYISLSLCTLQAQFVKDPLLDYYVRNFSKVDLTAPSEPDAGPEPLITPQTKIYCFEANFTDSEHKSVFITDDEEYLGAHGKYAWSVYCPVKTGGYRLVSGDSNFIVGGRAGVGYVGYVDQIKRYGQVVVGKYAIAAFYVDKDSIVSQIIDEDRDHFDAEHYPKYFSIQAPSYHITTFTLEKLRGILKVKR